MGPWKAFLLVLDHSESDCMIEKVQMDMITPLRLCLESFTNVDNDGQLKHHLPFAFVEKLQQEKLVTLRCSQMIMHWDEKCDLK